MDHQGGEGKLIETVYGDVFLVENLYRYVKERFGGKITQATMVVSVRNTRKSNRPYHNSSLFRVLSENR